MAEEFANIGSGNLKLMISDSISYDDFKRVCEMICNLGYDCKITYSGCVMFRKKSEPKNE